MKRQPSVLLGLLCITWAIFTVRMISWCENGSDYALPSQMNKQTNDELTLLSSRDAPSITPSYLQWNNTQPRLPENWSFVEPRFCSNTTNFQYDPSTHGQQKILVHYHLQHNAGTNLWGTAKQFVPCALRSCWQHYKHCMVSMNQELEAENIRQNYINYGVQYVSYEMMLPPRFPLPFTTETARQGLFFTTIVRDPFKVILYIVLVSCIQVNVN